MLVFDRHEWECFLDGARKGEFDDAASRESDDVVDHQADAAASNDADAATATRPTPRVASHG